MPIILKTTVVCVFFSCTVSSTEKNTGNKRPLPSIPRIYPGWCSIHASANVLLMFGT